MVSSSSYVRAIPPPTMTRRAVVTWTAILWSLTGGGQGLRRFPPSCSAAVKKSIIGDGSFSSGSTAVAGAPLSPALVADTLETQALNATFLFFLFPSRRHPVHPHRSGRFFFLPFHTRTAQRRDGGSHFSLPSAGCRLRTLRDFPILPPVTPTKMSANRSRGIPLFPSRLGRGGVQGQGGWCSFFFGWVAKKTW